MHIHFTIDFIYWLTLQAKKKVLAAALGFGPGWRECGLPHPVPIACVGCGACDSELLQIISKITKGMYVIVTNISELSTFFKRQVIHSDNRCIAEMHAKFTLY